MASSEKGLVIGPRVPRGLAPAVEGLTREILRHRPQDIYTFAAHHFEQLIELRETGRALSNRKCRVLVDWIGPDNKCQPVSDGGSNHDRYRFSVRKRHDSIGETREAIKETTGTTSTKLLTRRRRRRRAAGGEAVETANRNGWSINETVKVFKKHACENKEKSRNTEKSKTSIEKEIHRYFEQRSPPLSKTAGHCRFHRSWSVEDMHLAKNSSRRFKENQVEPKRGSIELSVTSRLENGARTCNKSGHSAENTENISVRRLKRQKSAGQIEDVCSPSHAPSRINRERVEYIVAPRRTHSLFNVTSNGSCGKASGGKVETENVSNEIVQGRQSRRESFRGKGTEGKERKKSEEEVTTDTGVDDTREIISAKLNDSKGVDTVEDTNVITGEPRLILQEDTSDLTKREDSLDNQESVILPSVVTKPCSSSRHSENVAERSENDTNYLILPPIPDASKPIKREDNLVLPVLSKLSEVMELDQQPLKSSGEDRAASIENGKERMEVDAAVSESQTLQENDYDCRVAVDGTTENEERSEVNVEIGGNGSNATSDCIELSPTPVKSLENENENEKEKDEEQENEEGSEVNVEIGGNGSNSTSDCIELPPTPVKSLEKGNENDNEKGKDEEQENEEGSEVNVEIGGNGSNAMSDCIELSPTPVKSLENENENEKEKNEEQENEERSEVNVEIGGNGSNATSDCIELSPTPVKSLENENENEKEKNEEQENEERSEVNVEIGGNGSNAMSDCIELPPTPVKSLEKGNENDNEKGKDEEQENEIENGSSTTTIGDEQERERRTCPVGGNDELKSKLIEIETVERNIENTLTSSETVLIAEDERESVALRPVDCTSESESEKSSILFGNNLEAACIAGEMSGEKAACNTAEGSLCMSENDETDTIPREESNASTVVSSNVEEDGVTMRVDEDDGEQSERARHGSACRDQVSISCSKDVDLSCYVLTEGSPCEIPESVTTVIIPDKSIELQQSDDEIFPDTIEQGTNLFGEYIVYPAETCEYSTDNVDFLRDITDAVDRTLAYKDLGNIKEEAEEEEEEKCKSEKDATRDEVVGTRCTVDEEISDRVENHPSETTVCADQGRAEATLEDCTTVTEPCVPELNLDSFRDATSSVEDGSESMNVENLSEKENDDGNNVPCEPETTSTSFDTVSPKTKATTDENPLSESRPDPDRPQGENATSSNDCGIDRKDSCNLEEEIARELIEHLTGDASTLEETDKKSAEGADSLDNATSERATVSTATVEPVDMDSNTRDDSEVKGDSVASTYRSVGTIDETTFGCEQLSENRNQSELSREPVIDSRNNSLDAAVRIIQFRVREFLRRRRKSKKSDGEENCRQGSPETSAVQEAGSSLPRENIQLKNPEDPWTRGSSIFHGSRHTGEFHDSLPLPLSFPVPVREPEISKVRISPMNATVHALERIRDDPVKPSLTPKPDTPSFHYESPDTCVLLAFDLPKSLQLIENASNWSTSCVNMPSYIVRVDRDFDGDKVNSLAGERSDSDVDDIREPLALDRTSNSIVIEEILTDDEEEKERSHASRSDDAVDESASSTNFTFENIDFDSEAREITRET